MLRLLPLAVCLIGALCPDLTAQAFEPARWPDQKDPTVEHPIIRVGGDMEARSVWEARNETWRAGTSSITTPLPEGYPAPTPPGALEIKLYPLVRRAEFSGDSRTSDRGFWPLFNHIKRRDIAMTSPVEMDYPASGNWTMAFLYRQIGQGPEGLDPADGRVIVRDAEPLVVLALGGRGSYDRDRIERDTATLRQWLRDNPNWEAVGAPRALLYNGPTIFVQRKWLEVQIPVRRRDIEASAATEGPSTNATALAQPSTQ